MATKRIRTKDGGVVVVNTTPILSRLIIRGVVWERNGEWVGRAADGMVVSLGSTPADAENYLSQHPIPEDW